MAKNACGADLEAKIYCPESSRPVDELMNSLERLLRKLLYWDAVREIQQAALNII